MSLTTSYLKQQEEYSEKYGDKTIVLMQVGSFYEFYQFDPNKCEEKLPWPSKNIGHVTDVACLLNMVATRKDKKKPYSLNNCAMAGFPTVSYEKHRDVLLANNYTIVRIDQKKNGKDVERFLAEILSPTTNFDSISSLPVNNYIVSIYIEVLKEGHTKEDNILTIGLSSIDVTTGENNVLEIYSKDKDAVSAMQELYRYLNILRPKELIHHLKYKSEKAEQYIDYLKSSLNLDNVENCVFHLNKVDSEFLKIDYQSQFLNKIFSPINSKLKLKLNNNIIEDLGLERIHYGCVSYIILLQYCYEHNPVLVEKLSKPNTSWLDVDKFLILTHNAMDQLDILPSKNKEVKKHNRLNKNIDSLFSVVNYTRTALGKRHLLCMLSNPITDVEKLNDNYNMIDDLIQRESLLNELRNSLKEVPDLERYQRKLYLKMIKPNEFVTLFQGYLKIIDIYTSIYNSKCELYKLLFDSSQFNECLNLVLSKYNMEVLSTAQPENETLIVEQKLFHDGQDSKLDKYFSDMSKLKEQIDKIVYTLNSFLGNTLGKKLEYEGKENGLWTTAHKAKILGESSYPTDIVGRLQFVNNNKDVMITSDLIMDVFNRYKKIKEEICKYLHTCYQATLFEISRYNFFNTLNSFISKVDYICSNAKCAIENKYFKPKIEEKNSSYLEIKNLRHPVVECLISGEYVANDISLNVKERGILLYGQNSSGKSTFGKAVALNCIMAQAGMFTACEMTYYPYNRIITRLSGNDSILNGESSFIVEMKELRTILRNADERSLVIADEIARGTESVSATALSVSSIHDLIDKKSSFIFSTHLHSLVDILEVEKLRICHLSLRYEKESRMLIYDRKIKDGPGDSIYGLEVANSLGLEQKFMDKAYEVRTRLINENSLILSTKKSRYNSKVYVDSCIICGKRKDLATHHIKEQNTSDKNGFIGIMHKNIPGNLAEICLECHTRLHQSGLALAVEETSKGVSLTV